MVPVALFLGWDIMTFLRRLPLALTVACIYSGAIAILILAAPQWQLERFLLDLRIGEILPFFAPPLSRDAVGLLALVAAGLVGWILYAGLSRMRLAKRSPGLELPSMPSSGLLDQMPPRMPPRILPPRQIKPTPLYRPRGRDGSAQPDQSKISPQSQKKAASRADKALMLHLEPAPVKPPE
ncbi:MAG: hypothetical protein RL425_1001 [Pseudomonadota bacterium]